MLHCFAVFTGNCEGDWKDVNKNLQKALNNNHNRQFEVSALYTNTFLI